MDSPLLRWLHLFAPKTWLVIALTAMLLATGSAFVLMSRNGNQPINVAISLYDAVSRFVHDTIRLTLKTDLNREAFFVAPVGILDPKVTFVWVETYQDFEIPVKNTSDLAKAPGRLLDPQWNPDFPGI
jgi:hypothetical protein